MASPKGAPDSVALLLFFVFWYAGNMKYNEYNTASLNAVGGKTAGLTMTVATMQLGVCAVYALVMWIVKINPAKLFGLQIPTKQDLPKTTKDDIVKTLPVGFCSAAAHACTVFALGGDPLFGQIVKSGEPVLSALVNTVFYGKPPSNAKVGCLPIIVGGVAFASLKKNAETGGYALKFDQTALVFGMLANSFAAFKGSESKKLMSDKAIAERFGGVGNQFATTQILAFFMCLPVMFLTEGDKFSEFVDTFKTSSDLQFNLVMSGMAFYLYNELATYTLKATGPVTASVANTAKRVIVMVYMAAVTGKVLTDEQKIGAGVAICGVLLYSLIDDLLKPKATDKSKTA
uniref:Sugar phosphate transporter domain-containing protein n=1 Tax=Minutocellus polymorphus TaxID=265543 RepID=A0A7S0AUF4_9STRA|mmetsp:Transcript_3563/g.6189  ORF Transcript_3563/g.6189 Transcript_3563/m.6189 type:complete len:345 (+) Transcript_3563:119-1153(+)